MTAFELGFLKEALDLGVGKREALQLLKESQQVPAVSQMFNNEMTQPDTNLDMHQLELMHAMQEQAARENQLQSQEVASAQM